MGIFGTTPAKSQSMASAETRQEKELATLTKQEDSRKKAADRKRRGRASLISGSETGTQDTLG